MRSYYQSNNLLRSSWNGGYRSGIIPGRSIRAALSKTFSNNEEWSRETKGVMIGIVWGLGIPLETGVNLELFVFINLGPKGWLDLLRSQYNWFSICWASNFKRLIRFPGNSDSLNYIKEYTKSSVFLNLLKHLVWNTRNTPDSEAKSFYAIKIFPISEHIPPDRPSRRNPSTASDANDYHIHWRQNVRINNFLSPTHPTPYLTHLHTNTLAYSCYYSWGTCNS